MGAYQSICFKEKNEFLCTAVERPGPTFDRHVQRSKVVLDLSTAVKENCFNRNLISLFDFVSRETVESCMHTFDRHVKRSKVCRATFDCFEESLFLT